MCHHSFHIPTLSSDILSINMRADICLSHTMFLCTFSKFGLSLGGLGRRDWQVSCCCKVGSIDANTGHCPPTNFSSKLEFVLQMRRSRLIWDRVEHWIYWLLRLPQVNWNSHVVYSLGNRFDHICFSFLRKFIKITVQTVQITSGDINWLVG